MTILYDQILELRKLGKSYQQIANKLGCSPSTPAYYLSPGQKERCVANNKKRRHKHPYTLKLESFKQERIKLIKTIKSTSTILSLLRKKIINFNRKNNMNNKNFTIEDLLNKFGENPKCYLTGESIDIYKPRTYQFDHIIPRSRGGQNTLDNLGICTKKANIAKSNMTPDEFINLCKLVLENNGYKINKI